VISCIGKQPGHLFEAVDDGVGYDYCRSEDGEALLSIESLGGFTADRNAFALSKHFTVSVCPCVVASMRAVSPCLSTRSSCALASTSTLTASARSCKAASISRVRSSRWRMSPRDISNHQSKCIIGMNSIDESFYDRFVAAP